MNYYNEWSKHAAAWLQNLMDADQIPKGHIDDRSIADVTAADVAGYTQHHFFCGIAGWPLALRLAGWHERRRVVTGSLPCQPYSAAGLQRGHDDERDLWHHQYRLIRAIQPPTFMGEQVPGAVAKGWYDRLVDDMALLDYEVGAVVAPACSVGAQHKRERLYVIADAQRNEQRGEKSCSGQARRVGRVKQSIPGDTLWSDALATFGAMDDAVPRCVAGTDAARNAIVPTLAAEIIAAYLECRP